MVKKMYVDGELLLAINLINTAKEFNDRYRQVNGHDVHIGFGVFHEEGIEQLQELFTETIVLFLSRPKAEKYKKEIAFYVSECMKDLRLYLMDSFKLRIQSIKNPYKN